MVGGAGTRELEAGQEGAEAGGGAIAVGRRGLLSVSASRPRAESRVGVALAARARIGG